MSGNTERMISQGEVRVARLTRTYINLKTVWNVKTSHSGGGLFLVCLAL